ncbi:hypothetical protein [Actinomadura sp. 9N215]|uniref:hypothetical protein n=1 Tax=Actinomadura sp. 9N215 TaxID=3375150 RepID=UPI00379D5C97
MLAADWRDEIPETMAALSAAQYALLESTMALGGRRYGSTGYGDRSRVIDAATLELSRGKWLFNRATGECADFAARTSSPADLIAARDHLGKAIALADASRAPDAAVLATAIGMRRKLTRPGTEIRYYHGTPIVPSICPIVVLRGSSQRMGAQYVQQCVEIFGRFVFEHVAARPISAETRDVLRSWEAQLREHAPEVPAMCEGMAEAARRLGIPLGYEHAISIWTDLLPPAREPLTIGVLDAEGGDRLGGYFGRVRLPTGEVSEAGTCSGAAAWGTATKDGRACFAASTDHDCTFQTTIVAYPDDGNAFVYTPFSVNGSIPGLGRFGLSGHPGLNSSGVAYVHHGGYESCAEPRELWGYGVPRGATTVHVLRYADTARQALEMELSFPVGDAGRVLGSASGFYIDDTYGYVLEDRTPGRPVVREHTTGSGGERHDLLYATNNLLSPELGHAFCPPPEGYEFAVDAGWHTTSPQAPGDAPPGVITRQMCTASSSARNRYLYRHLLDQDGDITRASLDGLFRTGPRFTVTGWDRDRGRRPRGTLDEASVGGRHNAFVATGTPSTGRYTGAVGMIAPRDSAANGPTHGYVYYDETGTHWDIRLGESAESLLADARATAERVTARAARLLERAGAPVDTGSLGELLDAARAEIASATAATPGRASGPGTDEDVAALARACRAFTRAQVRARQVIEAFGTVEAFGAGASDE